MNRRKLLLSAGAATSLVTAGCTDTSSPSEDTETNENEAPGESENNESDSDVNSSEPTIEITTIQAPETIIKGSDFDVTTTITTDTEATLIVEAMDKNGESVAEQDMQLNETGEQSITLSSSPSRQAALGNGSIRVQVTSGSITEQSTSQVTITADWQEAFSDAKENLGQFLSEFAAVSSIDKPTILDTTISVDYTNGGRELLTDAEDLIFEALDGVPDSNDSFRNKIQRLRSEIGVARDMSSLQGNLSYIFSESQDKLDSESTIPPDVDRINEAESEQGDFYAKVLDLNPIVGSRYEDKAEQFESELESVDDVFTGIRELTTARNVLDDESYDAAFNSARSAKSTFETVVGDINSSESYPPTDRVDQTFVDHVEKWESTANEIQLDAAAGQQSE